ncbi:MAG: transcription antitermination factor NusB [Sedimentisphaerales bacterium]|nr:transcription antitermination factor NusB [Sedimentisphaerales bacterium]
MAYDSKNQQPARRVAADLLNQFDPKKQTLKETLPKFLATTGERNVLMDIAFGIIRNRELIDTIIETIADVRIDHIQKKLLTIVRIGVYEMVFTPDRAEYAIVDAAVEEAKRTGGKKPAGFVNGILRNILRNIKKRSVRWVARPGWQPPRVDDSLAVEAITYPTGTVIQNAQTCCEFTKAILPDPKNDPASYLSTMFSLPQWLVEEWCSEFGCEQTRGICIASNRRPGVYVRPNTLKTTPQKLFELLKNSGIDCTLIAEHEMIQLRNAGDVTLLPGFDEGLFVVQDLTASSAVKMLAPQPGQTVLDMCAAPGTKTAQLAELMADNGTIFATDIDQMRLNRVETGCNRLQIRSIRTIPFANLTKTFENKRCDAVLLDVPCSNTGVLARRPEVRYRITPSAIKELTRTQSALLTRAAEFIKHGGKICYSTCSLQKQENSDVVQQFLAHNSRFVLLQEKLSLPSAGEIDHDGGYAAVLQKNS